MKKKTLITTIISICLLSFAAPTVSSGHNTQLVQAAARGKIKAKKTVRLYKSSGRSSKYFAKKNRVYTYTQHKKIHGHWFYKIGNNSHWLRASDGKKVAAKKYKKASFSLPKEYTRQAVLNAAKDNKHASSAFKAACMQGMKDNSFSQDRKWSESRADDQNRVDLRHLTKKQNKEISHFSLRIINDARVKLNLPKWRYSKGSSKLATDIAQEYAEHQKSIKTGHYIAGITRACKKNGLKGPFVQDNYVEDMAGFYSKSSLITMTELKKNVYFGIKQMLFGYAGKNDSEINDQSQYLEWEHAGDLLNTRGSKHDGDFDYYGFSISRTGRVYSLHYIGVPSFAIYNKDYNKSFKA